MCAQGVGWWTGAKRWRHLVASEPGGAARRVRGVAIAAVKERRPYVATRVLPNGHGIELRPGRRPWLECLVSEPKGYQISIGVSPRTSAPMPC